MLKVGRLLSNYSISSRIFIPLHIKQGFGIKRGEGKEEKRVIKRRWDKRYILSSLIKVKGYKGLWVVGKNFVQ